MVIMSGLRTHSVVTQDDSLARRTWNDREVVDGTLDLNTPKIIRNLNVRYGPSATLEKYGTKYLSNRSKQTMIINKAGEQTSMKKNAFWVAAIAAGVAAVTFKFVHTKKKGAEGPLDSVQTWISSAEDHLSKINLKLHSNDSVA